MLKILSREFILSKSNHRMVPLQINLSGTEFFMRILVLFTTALFFFSCNSRIKEQATITGKLENGARAKIYFEHITREGDVPVDSAVADPNGNFTMENKAAALDYYLLRTGNQNVAYLILKGG